MSDKSDGQEGKIRLNRSIGLFTAVSTIFGAMIGSGIFIAPKGVLIYTGSFGLNLIVWALCGFISMGAALCYAELGTLIPENGGEFAYLRVGLGPIPAFLSAYTSAVVIIPIIGAVLCLAAAKYLLSLVFGGCLVPVIIVKLTAVLLLWLVMYINHSVKMTNQLLRMTFVLKVGALISVVIGGIYYIVANGPSKLEDPFRGTTNNAWSIATSFYFGLYSFGGWEAVNSLLEEVKNVSRTLPRAIIISVLSMTALSLLVNVSYYSVLTTDQVLQSEAVAIQWGYNIIGSWSKMFSLIVSISLFGTYLALVYSKSRILMALARQGYIFKALSLVHIEEGSPITVLLFYGVVTPIFIWTGDILSLMEAIAFVNWTFRGLCFVSLVRLKLIKYIPERNDRVFRLPLVVPVLMTLITAYLITVPVITNPGLHYLYTTIFILTGLVFYVVLVYWKPNFSLSDRFTMFLQLCFSLGVPDKQL